MVAKTHILLTAPCFVFINSSIYSAKSLTVQVILFCGLIIGSVLPDIDEPHSYISRKFKIFSFLVQIIFFILRFFAIFFVFIDKTRHQTIKSTLNHRGITHFLILPIFIFLFSFLLPFEYAKTFIFAISIGWLFHEFGDMMTKGGIKNWLFPFFINKTFWILPQNMRFMTNSYKEFVVMFFLFVFNIFLFADYFGLIDYFFRILNELKIK